MAGIKPRNADVPRNLKPYILCLLKKGPRWNVTEGHEDLMPKYLAYLRRETEARRILSAGPVVDESDLIAIVILDVANAEEATKLSNANPGILSGHFVAELHPCFLPTLNGVQVEY